MPLRWLKKSNLRAVAEKRGKPALQEHAGALFGHDGPDRSCNDLQREAVGRPIEDEDRQSRRGGRGKTMRWFSLARIQAFFFQKRRQFIEFTAS